MNDLQFYKVGDRVAGVTCDAGKPIVLNMPFWKTVEGFVTHVDECGNYFCVNWDNGTSDIVSTHSETHIASREEVERKVAEHNARLKAALN